MADRRSFLAGMLAAGLCPGPSWADVGSPAFLAAARIPEGSHALFGLTERGEITFRLPLPSRGHAAAAHPSSPEAVVFARRPGTFALVLDCRSGALRSRIETPAGRHFYGHGTFSSDGSLLFTTENDYSMARGVVGIWDASRGYVRTAEVLSGGTGPHDMILMPDGTTLAVANGGIDTHPDSGRAPLNLPTMSPNLSYLDLSGRIVDQFEPESALRKNSIRHLALAADETVCFAMQWQGDPLQRPPLLGIHRRGGQARFCSAPPRVHVRMKGYAGSIAAAKGGNLVAVTSPRGGVAQIFDVRRETYSGQYACPDICGVSRSGAGFAVTAGTGLIAGLNGNSEIWRRDAACQWDNHLVRVS